MLVGTAEVFAPQRIQSGDSGLKHKHSQQSRHCALCWCQFPHEKRKKKRRKRKKKKKKKKKKRRGRTASNFVTRVVCAVIHAGTSGTGGGPAF